MGLLLATTPVLHRTVLRRRAAILFRAAVFIGRDASSTSEGEAMNALRRTTQAAGGGE